MPVVVGVLGALVGSFLNVVAYRVPLRRSVVSPPSACPSCGARIRARDNVPVVSWLVLGGRCRDCRARISPRYPLVELVTAVAFGLVAWWALASGMLDPDAAPARLAAGVLALVAFLFLAAVSIALALIDLDSHLLPNRIVLPALAVGAVLLGASALLAGEPGQLLRALAGMLALGAFYAIVAFAYPGGMGFGDVKLALVIGLHLAWVGWGALVVGAFAAFLLGALWGIGLIATRRAGRRSRMPFGPWMLAGAWIGLVAGDTVMGAYLGAAGAA